MGHQKRYWPKASFLNLFPAIFALYFSNLNQLISYMGCLVALIYSMVLVMLSNTQENVWNPLDNKGLNDIDLDRESWINALK